MAALRGRAGKDWQPFSGNTEKEGEGQSKKVSTGKGKQRRQARSDGSILTCLGTPGVRGVQWGAAAWQRLAH